MKHLGGHVAALAVLLLSTPALAQTMSLGEVARRTSEQRAKSAPPSRVYTNADLQPDARATTASSGDADAKVFVSVSSGQPASAAEIVANSEADAILEESAQTDADDEKQWRARAAGLRLQIDAAERRLAVLRRPVARPAAAQARTDTAIEKTAKVLEQLVRRFAALETEAKAAGVPFGWLQPSQ